MSADNLGIHTPAGWNELYLYGFIEHVLWSLRSDMMMMEP